MIGPTVVRSRYAYSQTIDELTRAIAAAGSTLFAKLDQSAAARTAGLTLRPTTLLIFGNPKGGTPLMDDFPLVALDLPLKLIVWDDGAVCVAYIPISALVERYGISSHEALLKALDQGLEALVATVS